MNLVPDALMQEKASAVKLNSFQNGSYLHIQITPPEQADLPPTDLIAILDISGSMETEAWVKNKEGIKETSGLTILDVLKHAVKTTIYNLTSKDRFGLVSFSDFGCVEYELEYMSEQAQKTASNVLSKLETEGSTNLWSGLFEGLELQRKSYQPNRQSAIILLTDGEPNVFPPSSFEDMLEKYKMKYPDFNFALYTVALGKYLDSKVLSNLANIGGGQYSFIPCPGFMGTIFVNTFTNIITTMCNNAELMIKLENDNKIVEIVGFKETKAKKSAKQAKIPLGDIKYGQNRDIILKVEINPNLGKNELFGTVTLTTWNWGTQSQITVHNSCFVDSANNFNNITLLSQLARLLLCDAITDVIAMTPVHEQNMVKSQERMKKCVGEIKDLQKIQNQLAENEEDIDGPHEIIQKHMTGILKDAEGEVSLSVLKSDFWRQWGRHYVPSVRHAHFQQACNNFIDAGVQFYGGKMFKEIRNQVEETFLKIPPPEKARKKIVQVQQKEEQKLVKIQMPKQQQQQQQQEYQQQQQQQQQQRQPTPPSPQMQDYYDCGGGGCFSGACQLFTLNGFKRIDTIKKGDIVINSQGNQQSKVLAVIKILCKKPVRMVKIGKLLITPKHPVFINGKWEKPRDISNLQEFCQTLYNLVLKKNHTILVEGVMCTTFGHLIQGENVEHPYFGTNAIINDLKKIESWKTGNIEIWNEQFRRDSITHKINGLFF